MTDGVRIVNGIVTDYGVVSTPQLHYFVTCHNTDGAYGEATEIGYYTKLAAAFRSLRPADLPENGLYRPQLRLDGANGVGALKMDALQAHLGHSLRVDVYNKGDGRLNHQCGADYVKVQQKAPEVNDSDFSFLINSTRN